MNHQVFQTARCLNDGMLVNDENRELLTLFLQIRYVSYGGQFCHRKIKHYTQILDKKIKITRYPIGDFLLFEKFSNSSQSSFSANADIFSHQYLKIEKEISHQILHQGKAFFLSKSSYYKYTLILHGYLQHLTLCVDPETRQII